MIDLPGKPGNRPPTSGKTRKYPETAFSKAVRYYRRQSECTQTDFAAACDIGITTLQDIESGKISSPQLDTIKKIVIGLQALSVNVDLDAFDRKVADYEMSINRDVEGNHSDSRSTPAEISNSKQHDLDTENRCDAKTEHNFSSLTLDILNTLIATSSQLENRAVSGTHDLLVRDFVCVNGLRIPPRWRFFYDEKENSTPIEGVILDNLSSDKSNSRQRYFIIGDKGIGKSLLAIDITLRISKRTLDGNSSWYPIYMDLGAYRNEKDFGTLEWISQHFPYLLESSAKIRTDFSFVIILDALDELLSGDVFSKMLTLLSRPIFEMASIITCRSSFFLRHIQFSDFVNSLRIIELLHWLPQEQISQFQKLYRNAGRISDQQLDRLRKITVTTPRFADLMQSPLQLIMILDLARMNSFKDLEEIGDRAGLYAVFCYRFLQRESTRPGSTIPPDQKDKLLQDIAWRFFDDNALLGDTTLAFTRGAVSQFLIGKYPQITHEQHLGLIAELIERSLLHQLSSSYDLEFSVLRFSHKSIHEFFVAKFLFVSLKDRWHDNHSHWKRFFSQEVTQFLQEMILWYHNDASDTEQRARSLISIYNQSVSNMNQADVMDPAERVAQEQVGFFLGHFDEPKARQFVFEKLADKKLDPFVRRGIVIGMSFGGDNTPLLEYVDQLREERARGEEFYELR